MDYNKIKGEIVDFILNSPDEVNSKVAVFITGMQSQKIQMEYRLKKDNCQYTSPAALPGVKIRLVNE